MFTDIENDIKLSRNPNSVSGHIFQENLKKGLIEDGNDVYTINIPRIRHFPDYNEIIVRTKMESDHLINIGFINVIGLNILTQLISFKKAFTSLIKRFGNEPFAVVIFNSHFVQSSIVTRMRRSNMITCDVIGDLHGKFGLHNHSHDLLGRIKEILEKREDVLARKFDSFALLTDAMADALNIRDIKPFTVVEGFYKYEEETEIQKVKLPRKIIEKKIVFYAGTLSLEYDIPHLIDSFMQIDDPHIYLIIAGRGDGESYVKEHSLIDNRILYLGTLTPSEVRYVQSLSTVLVSPRRASHDYVKYSFPSKTLECLASGKPYIAHKLPGETNDYSNYIQYPADESDKALADKIEEICNLNEFERNEMGKNARNFVIKEKNPQKMCMKITNLLSTEMNRRSKYNEYL